MALTLVHKTKASALKLEDLQRYPGSSLAAMVSSVSLQDGPVTLQLDELTDSPLADWPEAVDVTAALYRADHKALLTTLSNMLKAEPTAKVYNKLNGLVDYLGLPDPVHKLLPSLEMVTLGRLPVLDLYYHVLASSAVDLMLNSSVFITNNSNSTWKADAAYFLVSHKQNGHQLEGLHVYAVGGGNLSSPRSPYFTPSTWKQASENAHTFNAGSSLDVQATLLSGADDAGPFSLSGVLETDATAIDGQVAAKGVSPQSCLGRHIDAILKAAVNNMMGHESCSTDSGDKSLGANAQPSCDAIMQSTCVLASFQLPRLCATGRPGRYGSVWDTKFVYLWVIHW